MPDLQPQSIRMLRRWLRPLASLFLVALTVAACGLLERDNATDPGVVGPGIEQSVALSARLPAGEIPAARVQTLRYEVTRPGEGGAAPLAAGPMNLVGRTASALIGDLPESGLLLFSASAFDGAQIRTFSGYDTVLVATDLRAVQLDLTRLTGSIELTAQLPEEIISLDVVVASDGDSLRYSLDATDAAVARLPELPTGASVVVVLRARDADEQVLIQQVTTVDIRAHLVARIALGIVVGALEVTASFPDYIAIQAVDRFSDDAGTFYRRSADATLPAANAPIDFDLERFFYRGFGPDGESVDFYNLDAHGDFPAPVYIPVDRLGDRISGQLPVFGRLPGDGDYNDMHQIHRVSIPESSYRPNSLRSVQAITDAGYTVEPTQTIMNCVIVPAGSSAARRLDPDQSVGLQDGWHEGRLVKFLLFESPEGTPAADFVGESLVAGLTFAFLANDRDFVDGFERGTDGLTHKAFESLPGDAANYSPLWLLRVLRLSAYHQVTSATSAALQGAESRHEEINQQEILINAPIVRVN
jgi:hypothetical protein